MDVGHEHVWVFNSVQSHLPSGVFTDLQAARDWIKRHGLSGMLTAYPVNCGVYDFVVERGAWTPKEPHQTTPRFIGRFSSAILEHFHYKDGEEAGGANQG
jgi:hypothetical protein